LRVNWLVILRRVGIASGVVTGIFALIVLMPYLLGGASTFIVFPFYNLVCTGSRETNIGSALLKLPRPEDFQTFLNDQGCTVADAEVRDQQKGSKADQSIAGMNQFFGDDLAGRLFSNLSSVMVRQFYSGEQEGIVWLLNTFKTSVLFEALYYFLYTAVTISAIQILNSATQDLYHYCKRLLAGKSTDK
jgi:hypothetical protein